MSNLFLRASRKNDKQYSPVETKKARQVKGDRMMGSDLFKHMKMVLSQLTKDEPMGTNFPGH